LARSVDRRPSAQGIHVPGSSAIETLLGVVKQQAARSGRFARVQIQGDRLVCEADGSAEPAWYRVDCDKGRLWVSLVMRDRWLSESIEADLMHTGDKLEELIDEELVDQGVEGAGPTYEHFRSDDMLFTFRTPISPVAGDEVDADRVMRWLLAYEACFRNLGDMESGEGEE
jgi:hypothetical protein